MKTRHRLLIVVAGIALLAGCETNPFVKQPEKVVKREPVKPPVEPVVKEPPPPVKEAIPPGRKDLNAGIDLYNAGDYNGAIKTLNGAAEIWKSSDKSVQLEAHKYIAFSYCLTNRQLLCKQQFQKAFKLDRDFKLTAGEKGHPLWTPAFEKARTGK
jgi:hypothetical protein